MRVCFSLVAAAVTVAGNSVLLKNPSELAALKQVTRYLVLLPKVPGEFATHVPSSVSEPYEVQTYKQCTIQCSLWRYVDLSYSRKILQFCSKPNIWWF